MGKRYTNDMVHKGLHLYQNFCSDQTVRENSHFVKQIYVTYKFNNFNHCHSYNVFDFFSFFAPEYAFFLAYKYTISAENKLSQKYNSRSWPPVRPGLCVGKNKYTPLLVYKHKVIYELCPLDHYWKENK